MLTAELSDLRLFLQRSAEAGFGELLVELEGDAEVLN